MLVFERSEQQRSLPLRKHISVVVVNARRRYGRRPGGQGLYHVAVCAELLLGRLVAKALDRWPAVVAPAADDVDLIVGRIAVLGGIKKAVGIHEALRVAVAPAPDGAAPNRVIGRNAAIEIDAVDLAIRRGKILRVRSGRRIAGRDEQLVADDEQPRAIVVYGRVHIVEQDERRAEAVDAVVGIAHYAFPVGAALQVIVHDVHVGIRRKLRMQRHAEHTAFALYDNGRLTIERVQHAARRMEAADVAVLLRQPDISVGTPEYFPGYKERVLHNTRREDGAGREAGEEEGSEQEQLAFHKQENQQNCSSVGRATFNA